MTEAPTSHHSTALDPLSYAVDVLVREARRHRRQTQIAARVRQAPGRVQEAPGRGRRAPGRARQAPGRVQEAPGRGRQAPGRVQEAPVPGRRGAVPGPPVPGFTGGRRSTVLPLKPALPSSFTAAGAA